MDLSCAAYKSSCKFTAITLKLEDVCDSAPLCTHHRARVHPRFWHSYMHCETKKGLGFFMRLRGTHMFCATRPSTPRADGVVRTRSRAGLGAATCQGAADNSSFAQHNDRGRPRAAADAAAVAVVAVVAAAAPTSTLPLQTPQQGARMRLPLLAAVMKRRTSRGT